jgi:hypothetical protein
MTVSTTTNRAGFVCNGVTYQFPFDFKILAESDLQVYLYNTITRLTSQLTLNVDYTVEIASPGPGGTVTLIGAYGPPCPPGVIPGAAYTLTILRAMPRTQEIDFVNGDDLDEQNIEGMGDRITMMVQELDNKMARTLAFPPTSGISNISVPDPVAGAFLRWNLSGNGLENATYVDPTLITISDYWRAVIDGGDTLPEALTAMGLDPSLVTLTLPDNVTISDFIKTLLDDNDAAAARATLGALAASDLTAASESAAGIAEIATHAETDAGTDDARIVTPDKLYNTPGPWRKNLLMNGLARIYQRPSITISSSFQIGAVDRWLMFFNSSSGTPTGTGSYSTGYTQLVSGKAIAATGAGCSVANQLIIGQRVEGADAAQIAFALAAGRKLSFQAKIYQNTGGACDAFINLSTADALDNFSAATQRYSGGTVSIPSATWTTYKNEGFSPTNTNFANGFVIYLVIVTPASMSGKTFYWGDIQLEIGSKCTDLEVLPFQQELALCQRFWEKSYDLGTAVGTATLTGAPIQHGGGSLILTGAAFKVQKRAAPTVTIYSPYDGAADRVCYYNAYDAYGGYQSPCYGSSIGQWGFNLSLASSPGFSSSYMFRFHFTASAEL